MLKLLPLSREIVPLSRELFSFPCKRFVCNRKLLFGFGPHGRGRLFGCLHERTRVLFCNGAQDVRCRCAEIGFELSAKADADAIERRTDVIVERR